MMQKCEAEKIIPHRSYRRLKINKLHFMIEVFFYLVVSLASTYFYIGYLLNEFNDYFTKTLQAAGIEISEVTDRVYGFPIRLVDLSFAHTPPIYFLFMLIGMTVLFFILKKQKLIPYNIAMWINFFMLIAMLFVLYFLFFGESFPYSFSTYLELFVTAHIGLMLFSFIITGLAIALTPAPYWMKGVTMIGMICYYLFYSLFRFGMVVLLVSQVSIVMAPIMFFILYFDFIFFVSVYSYFLYKSAVLFQKKDTAWKW